MSTPRRKARTIAQSLLLAGNIVLGGSGHAAAAPLPPEACELAKAEHKTLADAGIPDIVRKGPAWAKSNVSALKLKDVQRYIGLQEQLQFRCGLAKLRELPIVEDETADPAEPARTGKDGDQPAEAATPPAKPKVKPKPPVAAGSKAQPKAAEAQASTEAPPKPKPKPAAKPKPDDAYRPPAKPETSQD